jgi:hypothetical protein
MYLYFHFFLKGGGGGGWEKLGENETGQEGEIYTNEEMNITDTETPPTTTEEMEKKYGKDQE